MVITSDKSLINAFTSHWNFSLLTSVETLTSQLKSYNLPPTVMPQADLNNRKSGEENEAYEMEDGPNKSPIWSTPDERQNGDPYDEATRNTEDPDHDPGTIEKFHDHVQSFFTKNELFLKRLFYAVLVVAYFVYFGIAMDHEYGDEQSIRLLFCTVAVCVFITIHFVSKMWGKQTYKGFIKPLLNNVIQPKWHIVRWLLYIGVFIGIAAFIIIDVAIDEPRNLMSLCGIAVNITLLFAFSKYPSKVKWQTVITGLYLQFIMAIIILRTSWGYDTFEWLGDRIEEFLAYTDAGSEFVFGEGFEEHYFAFKVLPIVIFFSTAISVLYYLGVMQMVILKLSWIMQIVMGTTAGESLNAAGNIFIGQTEAPLLIEPLLKDMTCSEIHAVMTGGFATIAGAVMATFILWGIPANHLLSASIMAAPAALAYSKLSYPETEESKTTSKDVVKMMDAPERNIIEAASNGASKAIGLAANIAANLIAFIALLEFVNTTLAWFGHRVGLQEPDHEEVSFEYICSYVLWPLAFLMGIEKEDCRKVAELIGVKIMVNEFVAFEELAVLTDNSDAYLEHVADGGNYSESGDDVILHNFNNTGNALTLVGGILADRSIVIATYALCSFANFSSIGIQLGGLGAMAPSRKSDLASIVLRAMITGNIACFTNACIAGLLFDGR